MSSELTTAEKVDAIYAMLVANQARMSRAFWYRILKWCLILGIGYFTLTHPGYVVGKMTEYLQPIIMEQMQTILANQKNWLLESVKKIMPKSESQPPEQY